MMVAWRLLFCLLLTALGGCSSIQYYAQAVHGEMSLIGAAKPIDKVLADPDSSDKLKAKLTKVQQIRQYAVTELGLPDNASYKRYADLHRQYVLWNIVATPELSLTPKQWCFPIAGCVAYRGYYDKDDALAYAAELRAQGYDVEIGGVPAYSTLGWFSDPVLSTFINYSDAELARMIFHELAHQVVYAPGDSQFNESFATSVEEVGVDRWLTQFGSEQMRKDMLDSEKRQRDFLVLLLKYRKRLEVLYASAASSDEKRAQKAAIFQALKDEYQTLKQSWGGYAGYDHWFAEPLNNAHLASIATYHDFVPAFKVLLQQQRTFPKFYEAVRELSKLDKDERHRRLTALAPPVPLVPLVPPAPTPPTPQTLPIEQQEKNQNP
jgi:predicted aminopeptidase